MSSQSGVSPEILPLPKGGGAIRSIGETFSPDIHTGTGSYRIPLRFLPGPGGFQPDMGLVYSSGGGNGPFGMGWLLPVLQVARKTEGGLPTYTDTADTFVLDRQELIALDDGSYRHRKEEVFRRVRRIDDGWEIRDRSGRTFVLGTTPAARIEHQRGGVTVTYAWLIERATDRNGNEIRYTYFRDGAQLYLESVRYGIYSAQFTYEPRTDVFTDRRAGFDISTGLRCSAIVFRIEADADPVFRKYTLTYEDCPYSGISQLSTVTMSGHRDGPNEAEVVALPRLRFRYTAFEPGHRYVPFASQTGEPPPASLADPSFDLLDLYGTGLPGVIQLDGPVRRFWPNAGNGEWDPPRSVRRVPTTAVLGRAAVAFADMNGDGAADLLSLAERPLGYFRNEPGVGFVEKARFSRAPLFDPRDTQVRFADLDGDGVVDAIRTSQRALYLYFNRGGTGWDPPIRIERVHDLARFPDLFFSDPRVKLADMSGDGLTDIVQVHGAALDWWPHYGNGRFGDRITLSIQPPVGVRFDPGRLFLSDINGDGVADLVYVESDSVRLWVNQSGRALVSAGEIAYTPAATATNVLLADMFGTGTLGLVWSYPRSGIHDRNYKYLDFTGGHRPYLLESIEDGTGLTTEVEYRPSTEHSQLAARERRPWRSTLPFPVQTVSRITARDAVTGTVTTQSIRYFDGSFDGLSREFRGFGRAEVLEEGGPGVPSTLTISHFHQGADGGVADAWALTGKLVRLEVYGPDGTDAADEPFRVEENRYDTRVVQEAASGARAVFPFLVETRVSTSERGLSAQVMTSLLSYDDFGNPVRKEDEWQSSGGGSQRMITQMAYTAGATKWVLNLPVELHRIDGSGQLLSLVRFYYDGLPFVGLPLGEVDRGNLTRREEMVLTDGIVEAVYGPVPPDFAALGYHPMTGPGGIGGWGSNAERTEYDSRGNAIGRMGALGHTGTVAFGPDGTYATSVINTQGHVFSADYDVRAGEIRRLVEPNGHETRYRFDAVGRLTAMVKPGDSDALPTIAFEHRQESIPLAVRSRARVRCGAAETLDFVEYFDGFKRTVQRRSSAEGGRVLVDGLAQYDRRGREAARTAVFFSAGFEYMPGEGAEDVRRYQFSRDALGRIVETVTPDGRLSRLVYEAGRVTAFDVSDTDASPENVARGHFNTPKIMEYDGRGRLTSVTENDGTTPAVTRYERDVTGRLTRITDARGVDTARYTCDLLGRTIQVQHVDAGRRRVALNARGDLALTLDAAGRRVEMQYDGLRRVIEVAVEGAVRERFFYDSGAGGNLVGRLARVDDEAGFVTFSYSPRGLLASKTRTVTTMAGARSFGTAYEYDALERMVRVSYPTGDAVDYQYNSRSLVERIDGVIDSVEYNEFGQRTRILYANGVEQRDTFDPLTFYLERSRVTTPTVPGAAYDVSYTFDAAGNPLGMRDHVTAPGHAIHHRQFAFDPLFRLIRSEGTLNGTPFLHAFEYDAAGNFTRNEEFSPDDLFLAPDGSNQIRCTQRGGVESPLFRYDANGNLVATPDATLEFDPRGRLRHIQRSNGTQMEFTYDHQGERARKRVTSGGATRETIYIDGIFEVRDGQPSRFVFHKDARVAEFRGAEIRFYHPDHLGSVVLVTDGGGAIVQEVAYRAFGAVGFHSTPAQPTFAFLGNEADAETGLTYCQSRFYDPRLGRFISPDLFMLLNPENMLTTPGALNLYVYAGNNPVKLIDKEGAWWKWVVGAVVISALVVATVIVGVYTGGAGFAFGILLMASIGSALGAGIGTYSASRAGGNLEDGFLVGALVGGAAGAASYAVGAAVGAAGLSGAWGSVFAGAAQGAVLGAGNGAIIGYGGGAGDWETILMQAGVGALIGAALGGLSGYVSFLSSQGGALQPGTFEGALGKGAGESAGAYGQPVQQSYSTGVGPLGQALDTGVRPTLNAIIQHTAHPMVYVSLGSVHHAAVYHDWDLIKAWLVETFGGEDEEVVVPLPT